MKTFKTKGLTFKSLYKLFYIGSAVPIFLLGLGAGIAAYLGSDTVMLNDVYVYDLKGLLTGVGMGILIPFILALPSAIFNGIGQWLWTRFRSFNLTYKE